MLLQTSTNEKFFLIAVCSYFLQRYIKIQYAVIFFYGYLRLNLF